MEELEISNRILVFHPPELFEFNELWKLYKLFFNSVGRLKLASNEFVLQSKD